MFNVSLFVLFKFWVNVATHYLIQIYTFKLIDYIKILFLSIDIQRLLYIEYLDFRRNISQETGLSSNKKVAKFHHSKIVIYDSGKVLLIGSIHKMYNSLKGIKAPNYNAQNDKGYNGNQFSLDNTLEMIKYLQELFDCKPKQMLIRSIEFGINTEPFFNPNLFIKGLLFHRNIEFEYRFKRNLAQAIHQQFILKIYNKSNQYGMLKSTLRIEVKYLKMINLNKAGIKTLADINNETLNKVKLLLLKRFDEVVYYDYTIRKKELNKLQKKAILKYSNPLYWIEDLEPNRRNRPKNRLKDIIHNHSDNLHQKLRREIITKCVINNQLLK